MKEKKKKNDVSLQSFEELNTEFNYSDFLYEKQFTYLCNIIPFKEKECLEIEDIGNQNLYSEGLVYVFVINKKILKIGHTIGSIQSRIASYNCGKEIHRKKGTCSTTNYFILQTLLNINVPVQVYAFFPKQQEYKIFDEYGKEPFPSPKIVEKIVIKNFIKKEGRLPIGCTQK